MLCYVLISTPGVVFSDAPAGPHLRLGQAMEYFRSLMRVHGLWACSKDGISVKVCPNTAPSCLGPYIIDYLR